MRAFLVVAACWVVGIVADELYVTTAIPPSFYLQSEKTRWISFWDVPTQEQLENFVLHNDKDIAELPLERRKAALQEIWAFVAPYRQKQIIRIVAFAVLPPGLFYIIAFIAVPWIQRGFTNS